MTRIEKIGDCTLYLADCMDVLPTLGRVDAVVTDPPWNLGYFEDDRKSWSEYVEWICSVKNHAERLSDGQAWFFSTKAIPFISHKFDNYKPFASIKNFSQMVPSSLPNCWDIAFIKSTNYLGNGRNWFICNTAGMLKERTSHPTPSTLDVMEYIVRMHDWACICDPFMGSGTTGVACANLGRKFIGIEIDESYFEISVRRIQEAYAQPSLFEPEQQKQEQAAMFGEGE